MLLHYYYYIETCLWIIIWGPTYRLYDDPETLMSFFFSSIMLGFFFLFNIHTEKMKLHLLMNSVVSVQITQAETHIMPVFLNIQSRTSHVSVHTYVV